MTATEEALPAGETLEGQAPPPAVELDYKALHEQAQAQLKAEQEARSKLEQQYRSTQGNLNKQLDIEAELARLRRAGEQDREYLKLLLQAQASGDSEAAIQKAAELDARHAQSTTQDDVTQQLQDSWDDIGHEIADAYGLDIRTEAGRQEALKRLQTAPELAGVWGMVSEASTQRQPRLMRQAKDQARDLRLEAQKKQREETLRMQEAAKEEKERALQGSAPSLKAGSSGRQSYESIRDAYIKNPYDPKIAQQYAELRKAKGL